MSQHNGMSPSSPQPKLLDQARAVIRARHYSLRTEETYLRWMERFIRFHGKRHPRDMGVQEVREFLTYLAVEGRVAASKQSQALSAILFSTSTCSGRILAGWTRWCVPSSRNGFPWC